MKYKLIAHILITATSLSTPIWSMHTAATSRMSALHAAVQVGNLEQVERCLEEPNPNISGPLGCTPLHIAAIAHDAPDLLHILSKNTTFMSPDEKIVVQSRRRYIVRLLLNAGARVDIRDRSNNIPLYYLETDGDEEMLTLLGKEKPRSKK